MLAALLRQNNRPKGGGGRLPRRASAGEVRALRRALDLFERHTVERPQLRDIPRPQRKAVVRKYAAQIQLLEVRVSELQAGAGRLRDKVLLEETERRQQAEIAAQLRAETERLEFETEARLMTEAAAAVEAYYAQRAAELKRLELILMLFMELGE